METLLGGRTHDPSGARPSTGLRPGVTGLMVDSKLLQTTEEDSSTVTSTLAPATSRFLPVGMGGAEGSPWQENGSWFFGSPVPWDGI